MLTLLNRVISERIKKIQEQLDPILKIRGYLIAIECLLTTDEKLHYLRSQYLFNNLSHHNIEIVN